ncbi:MAG: hypothetical protein HY815_13065 [Candidatus Riflebacteria bacterium]|nr:hypothetical protein [Candidatus Riflebacteria bacterium]
MERKLRTALAKMGFASDEVFLERTSTGKIGGHIVSRRFEGHTQEQRQDLVWNGLQDFLSAAELRRIVIILTMTPDEVADDLAA